MANRAHTTTDLNKPSRAALADAIERAIAILDTLDEDPDLEDGGDAEPDEDGEATLGWLSTGSQLHLRADYQDGEAEPDSDGEPSLGSSERVPNLIAFTFGLDYRSSQLRWGAGSRSDREQDAGDEGEEGCGDAEPSLGALTWPSVPYVVERDPDGRALRVEVREGDQSKWGGSGTNDCEAEHDGAEPGSTQFV